MNTLESKSLRRQRVLNPRAVVVTGVVLTALVFGSRKLHDRQFGKTVQFLRQSAYASLEANEFLKANMQLNQYLTFRPADMDAREKLSSLLSKHVGTRAALEQAFLLNEDLLRNDLPQIDLRLEQARIAVQLGKFSDAEAHLRLLQFSREDNSEIWYLSGHCASEQRKTEEAVRYFQRAISCSNPPEKAFHELAGLADANPLLSLDSETILDQMIQTCESSEAYRLRAMRMVDNREVVEALPLVWKGLAISPDDMGLNALLVHCLQSNNSSSSTAMEIDTTEELKRAIPHLQSCIERNPSNDTLRVHLAALLWKNQQESVAIQVLESGIARNARAFHLQSTLIEYLLLQKKVEKAERLLQELPTTALPKADRDLLTGRIEMVRKDWKAADLSLQRAVAYSQPGSSLQQRAQMLLAMCRSSAGNATTALDAFRTVLTANPNSVTGQLGMASAWIKAGRSDLAIAEYRQLLHVPGVPAYLADLLIQKNLNQPTGLRDWKEIANLTRDQDPLIPDSLQRILLQADMLMASGRISEAIMHLETARVENPKNDVLERAIARLHGEHSGHLRSRLESLATDSPDNHDVLAALVRLELGASRPESALQFLDTIATGKHAPKFTPPQSLELAIRTSETVTALETLCGRPQSLELVHDATRAYAYQLAKLDRDHEATLARVLAEQGRSAEALSHIRTAKTTQDPAVTASSLMAVAKYSSPREIILPDVTTELYSMIQASPSSTALRICYADLLVYGNHFETAVQVLEQIQKSPPENGEVQARLAWILAAESKDTAKARSLIDDAIQRQPVNPVFRMIEGRVLIAAGQYQAALASLESLNEQQLSQAAFTYRAAAHLELGDPGAAWRIVEQIRLQHFKEPMFPADERLLESVRSRLREYTTASRVAS